jgi:short-subunit dehydrogenase
MSVFSHQTAVVTGASSGLGQAISLALAVQGASLFLIGRKRDKLDAIAESARAKTSRVVSSQADLTVDENVSEVAATLRREFRSIDLLVHSAGVISIGPVGSAPVEELDRQYRVNVRSPYLLTQTLLPMLKACRGQIVFMNSLVGLNAKANSSHYSMTKHALKALADSLRDEVNADGVRVLSVFLGRTATPMQATLQGMEGRTYCPEVLLQPEDVAGVVLNALSLPRTAEVTDISIRHAIKSA